MKPPPRQPPTPLRAPAATAALAFAALVAAAALIHLPDAPDAHPRPPAPVLHVARLADFPADGALREKMALFDPAPLFMPATAALSLAGKTEPLAAAGEAARALPPVMFYPETRPTERWPRPPAPTSPLQAADLALAPRWFSGLSQVATTPSISQPPSPPLCRIRRVGDALDIAAVPLHDDPELAQGDWPPIEFSILIDPAGAPLLATPTAGASDEDIGERIRARLRDVIVPTLRLRPGLYRASISP